MGRDVKNEVYNMGNVMRNLIFSDYLVFPNEYMKEKNGQCVHVEKSMQSNYFK